MGAVGSSAGGAVAETAASEPGPSEIPAWPVHLGAAAVIGLVLWIAYGGGYVSLDAMWSLAWGRDLISASSLAESGTTTPHVLSNLIGAVLSPLGADADRGLVAVEFLAAGALVWCTALLAREIAGLAAGIAAGVLMALREQLLYATTSTFLDVLVAAFVVWAALLVIRGVKAAQAAEPAGAAWPAPPSPWGAQALLLLAGLLRPEAWVLAGCLWLWSVRSRGGLQLGHLALVAAAPIAWLVFDAALSGDALFSVHETSRVNAIVRAGQEIPDTLKEHVVSIPRSIARAAGPEVFLAALVLALAALRPGLAARRPLSLVALAEPQRRLVQVLLAAAVVYGAVLAAEALTGSLLFSRFAIGLAGLLVAVVAVGLTTAARALAGADGEGSRRSAQVLAALVAVFAVVQLPLLANARKVTGEEHDRYSVARAAVTQGVPCTPIVVPNTNIRAYIAVWTGVRGDEVLDAGRHQPPPRATFITATGTEPSKLLRDPSFPQTDITPITEPVREQGGWIVASTCGEGR